MTAVLVLGAGFGGLEVAPFVTASRELALEKEEGAEALRRRWFAALD